MEGVARIKQAEATKVIEAGDMAPAPTPTKDEAPTPIKEDTSHKHLLNEAAEIGPNRATRPAMSKSKR